VPAQISSSDLAKLEGDYNGAAYIINLPETVDIHAVYNDPLAYSARFPVPKPAVSKNFVTKVVFRYVVDETEIELDNKDIAAVSHSQSLDSEGAIDVGIDDDPDQSHFSLTVFLELDGSRRIDVEELVWFRGKGNDVVGPAAVIAAARVGDEDDFRFAVAVKVLASVILIKNHAKPGCAEHDTSGTVVDRRSAFVAAALAVVGRAERNLVSVPQFLRVGLVLRFRQASGVAGNLA
jgi:hypothetical protein